MKICKRKRKQCLFCLLFRGRLTICLCFLGNTRANFSVVTSASLKHSRCFHSHSCCFCCRSLKVQREDLSNMPHRWKPTCVFWRMCKYWQGGISSKCGMLLTRPMPSSLRVRCVFMFSGDGLEDGSGGVNVRAMLGLSFSVVHLTWTLLLLEQLAVTLMCFCKSGSVSSRGVCWLIYLLILLIFYVPTLFVSASTLTHRDNK